MLQQFFNSRSIALIGASRTKGKVGNSVLKNIIAYGWKGRVYPVNPKAKKILGKKCFASVLDVSEKVDLAVIMVPAKIVPQVLEECGQKQIPGVIIISAGFKEIGGKGLKLEDEIKKISQKYNIKILGPNCLGIISTKNNLNISFTQGMPKRGKVSLISQSGALVSAILDWAYENEFGLAKIITLGNKAGITENEALEYLLADPETGVIMIYLEDFADGVEFVRINRRVFVNRLAKAKGKPVIVLKAGRTEAGVKAATSHTGALAGSDEAVEVALKKCGVIRAQGLQDFFGIVKAFSWQSLPQNNKIAVITNAGGPGVMTADAIENQKCHIELANLKTETIKFLQKKLPMAASSANPIDLLGDALADRYQLVIEAVLKDKNVGGVIVILTPQAMSEVDKTARVIGRLSCQYSNKPILTSFIGGQDIKSALKILAKNKIPNYDYPEAAVKEMERMHEFFINNARIAIRVKTRIKTSISDILQKTRKEGLKQVGPLEAEKILRAYEIPVIKSYLVRSIAAAKKIAKRIGYPVVLKIVDPKIIHKTEKGGVRLDLKGTKEMVRSYTELSRGYKGIVIQKMVEGGQEVIVGMKRDLQFGPLLMFGLGGIFTEVLKDISFGLAPLSRKEAKEMILKIKGSKILQGFRNQKAFDINSLTDILLKLSQLSLDNPEIKEIDLNPVKVFGEKKGSICVDVKLLLDSS